jgi:glutaredoxin-like YruB-family protein
LVIYDNSAFAGLCQTDEKSLTLTILLVVTLRVRLASNLTNNAIAKKGSTMSEIKPQPKVIIFTTPTCSFCNAAKSYFRQKGIKFKDVDVSKDPAAARDMVRRSGQQGVPVIDIGGKIVVGFDRPKINQLLGIK